MVTVLCNSDDQQTWSSTCSFERQTLSRLGFWLFVLVSMSSTVESASMFSSSSESFDTEPESRVVHLNKNRNKSSSPQLWMQLNQKLLVEDVANERYLKTTKSLSNDDDDGVVDNIDRILPILTFHDDENGIDEDSDDEEEIYLIDENYSDDDDEGLGRVSVPESRQERITQRRRRLQWTWDPNKDKQDSSGTTTVQPVPAPVFVARTPVTMPAISNDDPPDAAWRAPTHTTTTNNDNKPVWKAPSSTAVDATNEPTLSNNAATTVAPTMLPAATTAAPTMLLAASTVAPTIAQDVSTSAPVSAGTLWPTVFLAPVAAMPTFTVAPIVQSSSSPNPLESTLSPAPTREPTRRPNTDRPTNIRRTRSPTSPPTDFEMTEIPTEVLAAETESPTDDNNSDDEMTNTTAKKSVAFDTIILNLFFDSPSAIQLDLDTLGKAAAYHISRHIQIIETSENGGDIVLVQNVLDVKVTPVGTYTQWATKNNTVLQTYEIDGRVEYDGVGSKTLSKKADDYEDVIADSVNEMIRTAFTSEDGKKNFIGYMEISSDSDLRRVYDVYTGSPTNLMSVEDEQEEDPATPVNKDAPVSAPSSSGTSTKLVDMSNTSSPITIALIVASAIGGIGLLVVCGMFAWKKKLDLDIISLEDNKNGVLLRKWDTSNEQTRSPGSSTLPTFSDSTPTGKMDNSTISSSYASYALRLQKKRLAANDNKDIAATGKASVVDARVKDSPTTLGTPGLFNQSLAYITSASFLGSLYNRDTNNNPDSDSSSANLDEDNDENDSKLVKLRKIQIHEGDSSDISSVYSYLDTPDLADMIQDEAYSVGNYGNGAYRDDNGFFDGDEGDDDDNTRNGTWSVRADDTIHNTSSVASVVTSTKVPNASPTSSTLVNNTSSKFLGSFRQLQSAIKQLTAASKANAIEQKAAMDIETDPLASLRNEASKVSFEAKSTTPALMGCEDASQTSVFIPEPTDSQKKPTLVAPSTSASLPTVDHDTESSTSGSSDDDNNVGLNKEVERVQENDTGAAAVPKLTDPVTGNEMTFDDILLSSDEEDKGADNNDDGDGDDDEDNEEPEVVRATVAERRIASAALAYGNRFKAKQEQRNSLLPKKRTDTNHQQQLQWPEHTTKGNLYGSISSARQRNNSTTKPVLAAAAGTFGVAQIGRKAIEADHDQSDSDMDIHSVDGDQSLFTSSFHSGRRWSLGNTNTEQHRLQQQQPQYHRYDDGADNDNSSSSILMPSAYLSMIDMTRNKYNPDTDDDLSSTAGSDTAHDRYDPNVNLHSSKKKTTNAATGNRTMFNDLASF